MRHISVHRCIATHAARLPERVRFMATAWKVWGGPVISTLGPGARQQSVAWPSWPLGLRPYVSLCVALHHEHPRHIDLSITPGLEPSLLRPRG